MYKQSLHVPVAGPGQPKFLGITRGREKFAFLYGITAAIAATCVIAYSLIASLNWWQTSLLLIACVLVVCTLVYSVLEMHRDDENKHGEADAFREEPDPYAARTVVVAPPTGEPYPHHEYYAESQGLDQGQLTSQLPDSLPFFGRDPSRRSSGVKGAEEKVR
ncbi:MAG: hypothetical protein WBE37_13125 [Bryobacteraceae bacterium]